MDLDNTKYLENLKSNHSPIGVILDGDCPTIGDFLIKVNFTKK